MRPETNFFKQNTYKALMLIASTLMLAAFILPENFYTPVTESEFTRTLKLQTKKYTAHYSDERIYLQCDRPMYEPGDDVWFAAYIAETQTLKASSTSDIVHVELIDPKGTVAKKVSLIAHRGKAAGDFSIDEGMPGGLYKLRAYTTWMKNKGEQNVYEKELQVQDVVLPNLKMKLEFEKKGFGPGDEVTARLQLNTNENKPLSSYPFTFVCQLQGEKYTDKADVTDADGNKIIRFKLPNKLESNDGLLNVMISYNGNTESVSASIPILLNKIDIAVFPEGGYMVNGLESQVAFRATNEYGKPADIDGVVMTEKGSQVAKFSSFHQGMGAFKVTPQKDEKYYLKITRPAGIEKEYELPLTQENGYVLHVDAAREGEVTATVHTQTAEELSVVAQIRGKICYTNTIKATAGANEIIFPTEKFPAGVMQVTLFDSKGVAQCERLAFVNRDRQLSIDVETEKEKFLPREKVKMKISVKDDRGNPVAANLSMSVVNDQFLSFANSKAGNILSSLLFQEDLQEKVEDASFYFNTNETKSKKALDFLLMTAGWRQFTWEKVMQAQQPYLPYKAEKAQISGTVLDMYTGKPVRNAKITLYYGQTFKADTNGKYSIRGLDLYDPMQFTVSAPGYNSQQYMAYSYTDQMNLSLYSPETYKKMYGYYYNNNYPKKRKMKNAGVNNIDMNLVPAMAEDKIALEQEEAVFDVANNMGPRMAIGNAFGAGHFNAGVANLQGMIADGEGDNFVQLNQKNERGHEQESENCRRAFCERKENCGTAKSAGGRRVLSCKKIRRSGI